MFNGVSLSSIILLTSLGLAITFGLMRVINMAHGEFVMIGAYTTYVVQQIFVKYCPESIRDVYYFVAIPAAFGVTFILGSLLEKFIISRLYGREIDSLLATWGISLILQQAARSIFGTQGVNVTAPSFLNGGIKIGGCTFSYNRLFIILLVALCLLLVWFIMYKSNFGKQMRAVMQNRTMAKCMGINSRKVDNITFAIGSGLAAIAGALLCSAYPTLQNTTGAMPGIKAFVAAVFGGIGSIPGAMIGGILIGVIEILGRAYISPQLADAIVFAVLILVLIIKPTGILGKKISEKV